MVFLIILFLIVLIYVVVPTSWWYKLMDRGTDEYRVKKMILTIYYGQPEERAVMDMDSKGTAYVTYWCAEPADTLTRRKNEGKRLNVGPAIIKCAKDSNEIVSWTIIR